MKWNVLIQFSLIELKVKQNDTQIPSPPQT